MAVVATRAFACVCLLVLWAAGATAQGWIAATDPEIKRLVDWMVEGGAQLDGVAVGRACPTCPRGLFTTREFLEDEALVEVPFSTILRLTDPDNGGTGYPAEYAREMLDWMHNHPEHNATWGPFWDSQPGPDGVFTPEVWTDEQLAMLQCPQLEAAARSLRDATEQLYDGTFERQHFSPFNETVPEDKASLDTFKYVSSLIGSRYFGFYRDGNTEVLASHLVPLIDLINHSEEPNAERSDDGEWVTVRALHPIQAGEELTHKYQFDIIHRPDMSLRYYGYVAAQERPLLAAVDLPGADSDNQHSPTAPDDSAYDEGGELCTRAEHNRLAARLAALPTSEAEDEALLEGGSVADWRIRELLRFRVMRKRALRQTLERLAAALERRGEAADVEGGKGEL